MDNSKNSSNTSKSDALQLPLKGFRMPLKSDASGWDKSIEGMGETRFRVHMTKIKK